MSKAAKVLQVLLGLLMRLIGTLVPIDRSMWIFGSHDGYGYGDNSKYLFLFLRNEHPETRPIWISMDQRVVDQVVASGGEAYLNQSLRGLYYVSRAAYYAFSTSRGDVRFFHVTEGRLAINLFHGMPIKKIIYDYNKSADLRGNELWYVIWEWAVIGFKHKDVKFIPSTSSFFATFLRSAFRTTKVFVTGLPRNDVFGRLDRSTIRRQFGIDDQSYVVTYMPTHRAYGKGKPNPIPFIRDDQAIATLRQQNIILLLKYHKNMRQYADELIGQVSGQDLPIRMLPFVDTDPQEILFLSDCLITDFSSCYVDFLLLDRPVIFFHYDNYAEDDNELYFQVEEQPVGEICRNEGDLLQSIVRARSGALELAALRRASAEVFHQFSDCMSSKRVFEKVKELSL